MQFTIVDIETTGLSAYRHNITEIAALKYNNGKVRKEFSTLINPEVSIPRFITRLTGINDEMVKDAPKIEEIISKFHYFLKDSAFVAHNAGFDYKFLNHASEIHNNKSLNNHKICTCRLARRLLPELPSKRLSSICEHFKIKNDSAHRAMGDAAATARIFHNFLSMMKEKDITDIEDILKFQKSKIQKTSYSTNL
ncbi:MAG: 3'-5' exonuclease [Nanoarchaeota archaeon]|nr:3'-5' exonuclease [Nanoarchaeota archaeon]